MDPRHRDRVAFVRVCSGEFARDMTVRNARTGAAVRLSRAMRLFADDRESLDVAYAGDVVGLANPGAFAIGDTLYEGKRVAFPPIPAFAPEHFAAVRSTDVSGYKSFGKGIAQLREEGAVQVFYPWGTPRTEPILGAVGELQFEVAKYRLEAGVQRQDAVHHAAVHAGAARRGRARTASTAPSLPSNAKLVEDWEGRPVGALRERVERAARARVESAADVRALSRRKTIDGGAGVVTIARTLLCRSARRRRAGRLFVSKSQRARGRSHHAGRDRQRFEAGSRRHRQGHRDHAGQGRRMVGRAQRCRASCSRQRDDRELRSGLALLRREVREARIRRADALRRDMEKSSTGDFHMAQAAVQ